MQRDRKNSRGDELLLYEAKKHLFASRDTEEFEASCYTCREKYSSRVFTASPTIESFMRAVAGDAVNQDGIIVVRIKHYQDKII